MPEAVVTALIGAIGGFVGGIVVAFLKPVMDDWRAKQAEARATSREKIAIRRSRIERVGTLLAATSPEGDYTASTEAGYHELRTAAAAIDDAPLTEHIGRMHSSPRGSSDWNAAFGDARHRTGELLSQLDRVD